MQFQNAALASLLVFVLVEVAKQVLPAQVTIAGKAISVTLLAALGIGIGVAFLTAGTVWAHQQVVGGHAFDTLNASSKVVVGLLLGAGAVGINKTIETVKNVGQNQ